MEIHTLMPCSAAFSMSLSRYQRACDNAGRECQALRLESGPGSLVQSLPGGSLILISMAIMGYWPPPYNSPPVSQE